MTDKPLKNVRILEFGGYISGPYATSLLCALGAEVVKVEKPGTGEDFRRQANDQSPYFIQYNAGKRSLAVDLKRPEGVALIKDLLPRFDVVVENLRPGKMAALGLGVKDCQEARPDLVYTSLSGFGEGGPLAGRAAYDTIGQAIGGLYSLLGDAGHPQLSGVILADLISGLSTATGILAALVGRGATGEGQLLQTSLVEAVSTITIDAVTQYFDDGRQSPARESRHPQAQNFCLMTASGDALAVHLSSSQKFWEAFARALDLPELIDDARYRTYSDRVVHYFELVDAVEPVFQKRTSADWTARLTSYDVPFSPVTTMGDVLEHPQTQWLELFEPERNGLSLVRPPWRFDGNRPERNAKAPRVGEDTRAIAGEVYSPERLSDLLQTGVLYQDQ